MAKLHVSLVLDESASMRTVRDGTISGYNEYIDTLKNGDDAKRIRFTLTKFNGDRVITVHDSVKVSEVTELNNDTYIPSSMTPLYDAIGQTVLAIEPKVKKNKKQRVLMVIQTDGAENVSEEFNSTTIFDLIAEKKKLGWTFLFLGADQDAWLTSRGLGISRGNTHSYAGSETRGTFATVATASASYAASGGVRNDNLMSDAVALEEEESNA